MQTISFWQRAEERGGCTRSSGPPLEGFARCDIVKTTTARNTQTQFKQKLD